jgi:hypothetical protein
VAFGLRIRELTTSGGGDPLAALPDGVVAIVGPNNSGKSALLREVHQYLNYPIGHALPERQVLAEIAVDKEGVVDDLVQWLEAHSYSQIRGENTHYKRANVDWQPRAGLAQAWETGPGFGSLGPFIAFLAQAEGRLGLVGGSGQYDVMNDSPGNPTQVLYARRDLEERLSALALEAFGVGVTLNRFGANLTLLWGSVEEDPPAFPSDEYLDRLRALPPLNAQGDGVKSFLGTMLLLLTASYPLVFIDEPEAFLHPPQAQLTRIFQ